MSFIPPQHRRPGTGEQSVFEVYQSYILFAVSLSFQHQGEDSMRTTVGIGLALALIGAPIQAQAENGQIAAGILGGLAAGAIIGSAVRPPPVYYYPAPAYVEPAPSCYFTRGAPVWDGYRGAWVRPRVRVCD
jgi:hypothetical protein